LHLATVERRQETGDRRQETGVAGVQEFRSCRSSGAPHGLVGLNVLSAAPGSAYVRTTKSAETKGTARKLACLICHLLKYKEPYQKLDPAIYQLRLQKSALLPLQNQASTLGYKLVPTAPVPV